MNPPAAPPRLDDFFDRVRSANPFTDNRSNGPSPADVDVDIHAAALARLTALADEALAQRRGIGAVLWGEAGIGKSHLLARFARWADQDDRACLVYLHNLQASPDNLPRALLKAVVRVLTHGPDRQLHRTQLYQLVLATLGVACRDSRTSWHAWPQAQRAFRGLVGQLSADHASRAALVDPTAYDVLFRFFRSACRARQGKEDGRQAALAVRWLSGDALDPEEGRLLGLPPGRRRDEPLALADNQQVKQVLVALTQLALCRGQPFVLCSDQVDNLDTEQAAALARFLEALIDSTSNLLVVTAGVQATLVHWRNDKVIQDSAWDRLAQFEVPLHRIPADAGSRLVASRLGQFLQPFLGVEGIGQRLRDDPLFPLGRDWAADFFRDRIEVRPRDVINGAREGWRREQESLQAVGGPGWLADRERHDLTNGGVVTPTAEQVQEAIDRKVAQKVAEVKEQRQREPSTLPPDADNLATLVFQLLEQCRQADAAYGIAALERPRAAPGQRPAYDLVVRQRPGADGPETRTGLLFVVTTSATSVTARLRRLLLDDDPPDRVLLVTDERQPPPLAAKGREYQEQLWQRGREHFRELPLTLSQYADLDALQAVVWLARSGDLEIASPPGMARAVTEGEVIESLHRQDRYRAAAVLREVFLDLPLAA